MMLVTVSVVGLPGGLHKPIDLAEASPGVRRDLEDFPDGSGELGSIVASSPPSEASNIAPSHVCIVLVLRLFLKPPGKDVSQSPSTEAN